MPTCRLHWERHGRGDAAGRYCYNGPAFRFQPDGGDHTHPREFHQAGIEHFGASNAAQAEAEILALILEGLRQVGLDNVTVRIGDLGIFDALLEALDMPSRWRQRLRAQFWRPASFRAELEELSSRPAAGLEGLPEDLVQAVAAAKNGRVEAAVAEYLDRHDIDIIGERSLSEIAANLHAVVEDAAAEALAGETRDLIEAYLGVSAPARAAGARMRDLMQASGTNLSGPLDAYDKRIKQFVSAGIDVGQLTFSAEFGRSLEYYTGFVFEVLAPGLDESSPVAGGGRYDKLMRMVGATVDVAAVGAMIHTERLLSAVEGRAL